MAADDSDGEGRTMSNMPKLYNMHTELVPPEAVRIDRRSAFGNPFIIGKHGTREEVCDKFDAWIKTNPQLTERIKKTLRGKSLACWCAPNRCHGETILRIANEETYIVDTEAS